MGVPYLAKALRAIEFPGAFEGAKKRASSPGKCHAILASRNVDASQLQIEKGLAILRQGGVIAFPTDTVYGLGADAFNSGAVRRIYTIKNCPEDRQFPLLIADVDNLTALAERIPEIARFLARQFWPGGLTLVLPRKDSVPRYLASGPGIAVRIPNHPVCLALIRRLGNPLIGTSANISGQPAAVTAEEVRQGLGGKIDLIIDGGRCPGGRESTVVNVTHEPPTILREGIIPAPEIDNAYREYLEAK